LASSAVGVGSRGSKQAVNGPQAARKVRVHRLVEVEAASRKQVATLRRGRALQYRIGAASLPGAIIAGRHQVQRPLARACQAVRAQRPQESAMQPCSHEVTKRPHTNSSACKEERQSPSFSGWCTQHHNAAITHTGSVTSPRGRLHPHTGTIVAHGGRQPAQR